MNRAAAFPRAVGRRLARLEKPARMGLAATLALTGAAAGSLVWASSASAAVPTFPDNIVVFPERDFVSVDGFEGPNGENVGKTAVLTVTRGGEVVGRAAARIAGGSPSFEVNHPGGVCWGNDPSYPQVTPDIKAGDVVTLSVDGEVLADTTTLGAAVTSVDYTADSTTLVVRGHLGPDVVAPAQVEQRIVAPDLVGTDVGRRDVRAVPGDPVPAPKGGYVSGLAYTPAADGGQDFVATYEFDRAASAAIAAAGGARAMAWQVEDLDANRQGLTISEFGEAGGPGMGGCPNGPLQAGPPAPSGITVVDTSSGTGSHNLRFTWTPATAVPGTPAITGYRVRAVGPQDASSEQVEIGKRINDPAATGTTLSVPGDPADYTLEVTSVNAELTETKPVVTVTVTPPDTRDPVLSITPANGPFLSTTKFTIASDEAGTDVYYVLSDPAGPAPALLTGDLLADPNTPRYTDPFTVTADTRISAVGFDRAGNPSAQVDKVVTLAAAETPAAPEVTAAGGEGQAVVSWKPVPDPVNAPVLEYVVSWTGAAPGSRTVAASSVDPVTTTVTGLSSGSYTFTVLARNAAGDGAPTSAAPVTVTERLTLTTAGDTTVQRGVGSAVVTATSNPGATLTWQRVASDAPDAAVVTETPANRTFTATVDGKLTVTVPVLTLPTGTTWSTATVEARNAPLYYRVTASKVGSTSVSKVVKLTIGTDTVSIATARYRAGSELRVTGSVTNPGATVRVYKRTSTALTYTFVGTATLTAAPGGATWELRQKPPTLTQVTGDQYYAFSSFGGGTAGFTASN